MIAKRLVVIGASAGGIDALRTIVTAIPDTIPAAVCIVLHMSPESPGALPELLKRAGGVRVTVAFDGERLEPGHVYVAPPDRHLLVDPGKLRVTTGPREHRFRPAIDPLFRSAAQVFGPNAIGVVLTGNLDDGTAGLWTIKRLGGVAIVQDPSDAIYPSMPLNAMRHVDVDYVVPASRIPSLLAELTSQVERPQEATTAAPPETDAESKIAKEEDPHVVGLEKIGRPSPYSCPDCSGVLMEIEEGGRIRFRCHTGHAYSTDSLLAAMNDSIDGAMNAAVRALEEARLLTREVATQLKQHNLDASRRLEEASDRAKRRAEAIRELILERDPVPTADE